MANLYESGVDWIKEKKDNLENKIEKLFTNKAFLIALSSASFGLIVYSGNSAIDAYKDSMMGGVAITSACSMLSTAMLFFAVDSYKEAVKEEKPKQPEYACKNCDYELRNYEFD